MSDELLNGLAGGAIGAVLAVVFVQLGRAWLAWREVSLHDDEAAELNAQLIVWVDDRTRHLAQEMDAVTNSLDAGQVHSGSHGSQVAAAKELALHQYRDRKAHASLDLGRLRGPEGAWHTCWRFLRRTRAPRLTEETLQVVEDFLERWRESVTRHGDEVEVFDRTRRTTADALAELPGLKLT